MKFSFRVVEMSLAALVAVSPIGGVGSAWADGPNTAPPALAPATPTPVITHTTTHTAVGQGGCQSNYTAQLNSLADDSLAKQKTGADAAVVGVVANTVGLTAQGVFGVSETVAWAAGAVMADPLLPPPGNVNLAANTAFAAAALATAAAGGVNDAAIATNVTALGAALVGANAAEEGVDIAMNRNALSQYQATRPDCDTKFTGTVTVDAGGVNVTGASLFNDDVGVTKDVNVEQNVNANQVHASQGISADGGKIWLGDPNGTTYSDGITIGGGAVSGAGSGQPLAVTGDVDAIAIGNNARAMMAGSVTLGLNSTANGLNDVVVGAENTTAAGGNNTVIGTEIDIIGDASSENTVLGVGHQVTGSKNFVAGDPNVVVGDRNVANGFDITVTGDDNVAVGNQVRITGNRAIAVGNGASASADNTTSLGNGAQANAVGSAAFGNGAVATRSQQQVFGTSANSYTAPGIATPRSLSRQDSGPLQVVTSDYNGNLATDGGTIFQTLGENRMGVAMAIAMVNPMLRSDQTYGIAVNWGVFEGSQAVSFSGVGVVAEDLDLMAGGSLALTGAFGMGVAGERYGRQNQKMVFGGRAGVQLGW